MLPFPDDDAQPGPVVIHTDGASRGNPGPSGAGAVLTAPGGEVLKECVVPLPRTTNNVAEYEAVLAGLRAAVELGAREVELRADSQLLIRQLQGRYKVKAEHLMPLHEEARRLLRRFAKVTLTHIPREENAHADALANRAIDGDPAAPPGPEVAREKRVEGPDLSPEAEALLEAALRLPASQRALIAERLRRPPRR